jgi:hypothetical protein
MKKKTYTVCKPTVSIRLDTGSAAFGFALISPLAPDQCLMPFQHRFRLEEPDQVDHLAGGTARSDFQQRRQDRQRQFFYTGGFDWGFLFSYKEVELVL